MLQGFIGVDVLAVCGVKGFTSLTVLQDSSVIDHGLLLEWEAGFPFLSSRW